MALLDELRTPRAEVELGLAVLVLAGVVGAAVVTIDVALQMKTECRQVREDLRRVPFLNL